MNFPVELKNTFHKAGGRITCIYGVEHETDKAQHGRSRDYWFFRGDVDWRDGSKSQKIEIAPYHVCYYGEERAEVDQLIEALNDYLLAQGKWYRTGRHQGWYADERPTAKVRRRA